MLGLITTVTRGKLPGWVFGEFYGKQYQSVYRAAKRVTRNFHDAQDIVQAVFARLLDQGRLSPDFLKNPEAYLCQAARNQARDLMRSRGRRKLSTDPLERLAVPAPEMEDPWMFDALTEAMEELGPDVAQAISLRYSEDLSDAEIGKRIGRSRVAVAMMLVRARARLKKQIEKRGRERS